VNTPKLTLLDKAALFTTGAGAAFKVLIWALGVSLAADAAAAPWLPLVRAGFAVLSFVAFDLVLGSVVLDARSHGMRWPGVLAVVGAAVTSALIALDVSGVAVMQWLHAAPAVNLLLYALHLMWPYAPAPATETAIAIPTVQPVPAAQVNIAIGTPVPSDMLVPRRVNREGFVYLLRVPGGYKIGMAKDVSSRVQRISAFVPFSVEHIASIATNNMHLLERRLHQCFADRRLNGEWFALTDDDVDAFLALGDTLPSDQIDEALDVLTAVAHLPKPAPLMLTVADDERDILRLKDVHGFSFAQIGERLGMSRQAAWQQYRAAKRVVVATQVLEVSDEVRDGS
jgi:hypothetical protein